MDAGHQTLCPWKCDICERVFESLDIPGQWHEGHDNDGRYFEYYFCSECIDKAINICNINREYINGLY